MEGRSARVARDPDVDEQRDHRAVWVQDALRRFAGPLTRYAARITGDAERARDVVQDTFVRLWAADTARLNGKLAEWLFTVCRRRALDINDRARRSACAVSASKFVREQGKRASQGNIFHFFAGFSLVSLVSLVWRQHVFAPDGVI